MTTIPESHPRYASLMTRQRLVEGVEAGLVAKEGLLAHGRGEAFDYLLGERTVPPAAEAERAAAAALLVADRPVLSVNGNTAVLAADAVVALAEATGARVEVNLFHRTEERVAGLIAHLEDHGAADVLGAEPDARLPELDHARALCCKEGIHGADWVVVPLEDGDRAQVLRGMGKGLIVVDLNPLSRSSLAATIPLVDNVTRALPALAALAKDLGDDPPADLEGLVEAFDADANRRAVLGYLAERLTAEDIEGFDGHRGGAQPGDREDA